MDGAINRLRDAARNEQTVLAMNELLDLKNEEIARLTKQRDELVFVLNQLTKIKFLCNTYADKQRSKTHMELIKDALASVEEGK